jgi:ribosomal protein S18 acetylase RimI-like enzyme
MSAFVEICTAKTSAAPGWSPLPWDSEQFGFPAARLEEGVDAGGLPRVLEECRRAGIRHLIARPDARDLRMIHALEAEGFQLLDGIQTFVLNIEGCPWPEPKDWTVHPFRAANRAQVAAIARKAFVYDRFHADAGLAPGVADQVHEAWIDNCCLGQMADIVWIAEDADAVRGFVTCKLDPERRMGTIGLVATSAAAWRRGVARALTAQALRWFHQEGATRVEVGTQLTNFPAARLYQSFGFKPISVSFTFRRLL